MKQNVEIYQDGQFVRVEQIDVPDPTPEMQNADLLSARADSSIAGLVAIRNSSGTLSAAQLSSAVRVLASALLAILRLQLRKFDSID